MEEKWLWPCPSTTYMGRGYTGPYPKYHSGLDIGKTENMGDPVVASKSGVVSELFVGCKNYAAYRTKVSCSKEVGCECNKLFTDDGVSYCNNTLGNAVIIKHDDNSYSHYAHFSSIAVTLGQKVSRGDVIGYIGATGQATNPHLHFSLSTTDNASGRYDNNIDVIDYDYSSLSTELPNPPTPPTPTGAIYEIKNVGAAKYLQISGDKMTSLANNTNIILKNYSDINEQKWNVSSLGDNAYIRSVIDTTYGLNVYRSGSPFNCNIYKLAGNETDSLIDIQPSGNYYKIKLHNYDLYLTVGASTDGTNVYWAASSTSNYQKWAFTALHDKLKKISPSELRTGQRFYMDDPQMKMAEYICMNTAYVGNNSGTKAIGAARVHVLNNPITNSATLRSDISAYRYSIMEDDVIEIINRSAAESNPQYNNWIKGYSSKNLLPYTSDNVGYRPNGSSWYYSEPEYIEISSNYNLHILPYELGIWFGTDENYSSFRIDYSKTCFGSIPDTTDGGLAVNSLTGAFSYCSQQYSPPYRAKLSLKYRKPNNTFDFYDEESPMGTNVYIKPYVIFTADNMPDIYVKELQPNTETPELNTVYRVKSHGGGTNGKYLTTSSMSNNQNVYIDEKRASKTQLWKVVDNGSGNYKLVSYSDSTYGLNYRWTNGYGNAGNCDIYKHSTNSDANIAFDSSSNSNNVFRIKLAGGTISLYLDPAGTDTGSNVSWEAYNNDNATQYWMFEKVDKTELDELESAAPSGGTLCWPTVSKVINQYYSYDPTTKLGHNGIDVNPTVTDIPGDNIYSIADGVVERIFDWNEGDSTSGNGSMGKCILVKHDSSVSDANVYLRSIYMHLDSINVKVGDSVNKGTIIGTMGHTGYCVSSTGGNGTHLHFAIKTNSSPFNSIDFNFGTFTDPMSFTYDD